MLQAKQYPQYGNTFEFSVPKYINNALKRCQAELLYLILPEDIIDRHAPFRESRLRNSVKVFFWAGISVAFSIAIGQLN